MKELPSGVKAFLRSHPKMALRPTKSATLVFEGAFEFAIVDEKDKLVEDEYELRIEVPADFPKNLPVVYELGGKIPPTPDNHVNPDGSLCLGSPLRLRMFASNDQSLIGFSSNCILPFLYAKSVGSFVFGELPHGLAGLVEDYADMLGVRTKEQVLQCLKLASLRRRVANKRRCPCGCGKRLGACTLRERINGLRTFAPRSWFKKHISDLEEQA